MSEPAEAKWLAWARRLQALAQNGLTYARDPFDIERYDKVAEIAAEMFAAGFNLSLEAARALFSAERGYATPKIDVRGVVVRDGAVLLIRENSDGRWSLPGGWADVGDAPSEAVTREILEEAGYRCRARRLLALLDRNRHGHDPFPFHIYKAIFHCEIIEELPLRSIESHERGFFRPDALPPLSTTRVTGALVRRMVDLALDPDAGTVFD